MKCRAKGAKNAKDFFKLGMRAAAMDEGAGALPCQIDFIFAIAARFVMFNKLRNKL
jgi:hypothetical protein